MRFAIVRIETNSFHGEKAIFNSINRTEQRVTILLIEGAACLIRSHVLVHLFTHLQTTAYGACAETFVSAVLSVLLIAVKLL